jgi:hypothetical protein
MQRQPVALAGHPPHPNTLDQAAVAFVQFHNQAVQEGHWVELGLSCQPDAAVERERYVGVVHPLDIQPGGLTRRQFLPCRRQTLFGLGVGVGILALHRQAVSLAMLNQPLQALQIALHVLLGGLHAVPADDFGQLGALQQADFRGGVAGGTGTGGEGLQHHDIPAGPGEQHGSDQPCDAGAYHDNVRGAVGFVQGVGG